MPKFTPSVLEIAGGGSHKSNTLKSARWIKADETVEVQGLEIKGGLFYLGQSLPRLDGLSNENCLVDPGLAVSQTRVDTFGHDMPYWPSYSAIKPWSRSAYLNWLTGTRADPASYIGYAFLDFYGVERRLFLDRECDDADTILAEVTRLLKVYASNRSFQHYGGALLEAYARKASLRHHLLRVVAPRDQAAMARGTRGAVGGGGYARRRISPDALYVAASRTFEVLLACAVSDACQPDLFEDREHAVIQDSPSDDRPVVIIRAPQPRRPAAVAIGPIAPSSSPIDWNKLSDIRRETQSSASLLDAIFGDGSATGPTQGPPAPTGDPEGPSILDDRHRAFLRGLLTQPAWARPDFDSLAKQYGLMPSAAKASINEWTYQRFDELILCGEDPVHIEHLVVPEGELGAAA